MSSRRALIAPIGLLLLLAAMTAFLAVNHLVGARHSRRWASHSHEVIQTAQTLFSYVQEVESEQRGFMITHDERFLSTFAGDQAMIPTLMTQLEQLTRDNPVQAAQARKLDDMLRERVRISAKRVVMMREGGIKAAMSGDYLAGLRSMSAARAAMYALMQTESSLLRQRTQAAERADERGFIAALMLSLLALGGLAANLVSMARANRRLQHEIGERILAEARRSESEALYRAMFANTADYLYVIDVSADQTFRVAEFNPALEAAIDMTTAEVRGRDVRDIEPDHRGEVLAAEYIKVIAGEGPVFTRSIHHLKAGRRVWESVLAPVRNAAGRVERIVGSTRDVTERDQAEEQLRRAQRMEAVGHLTGGVAHDFNNLLQVIRGNLEMVASEIGDREPMAQRLKNALHGAARASQLTRQLLAFARRQPLEPKVVNLGRLVSEMAELLRRTLGEGVEVETVLTGGLWNTLVDPAQVESAILNLAINARDAMPSGGRLTIEITNAALDDKYVARDSEIEPGQYVLLAVSDSGHGMPPETLARVFEPFFTTKAEEKGTGLGLSMVYGFVKQSHGHVQIYSEVDHGTTVKIYLPRSRLPEDTVEPISGHSLRGRSEIVLVAEDDDLVRASAVGMLRDLGYTCLHAADGAGALALLQQGVKVDLLFTDVIMPGPVKSRDLAAEAQRMRPGMPVLFTSGYTENAIVHHGRLDEGVQLLSKPYTREDLARKIRGLLQVAKPAVLVVEDDDLVRMSAVDMIEQLGFATLSAGDAAQALAHLESDARIDILFTDVGLPGMRGPELARKAVGLRSDLKVIFSSGYGETDETLAVPGAAHLGKPYQQDELAEILGPPEI